MIRRALLPVRASWTALNYAAASHWVGSPQALVWLLLLARGPRLFTQ